MTRKGSGWMAAALAVAWTVRGAAAQTSAPPGYVNLNLDQVDVRTFVKLVGDATGRRIVIDANVEGKVSIVSPRIPAGEIFPVFASILESVGCALVEEPGGLCRVTTVAGRTTTSAPVVGPAARIPDVGLVTKVFRLAHAGAAELRRALEGKVRGGKDGAITALDAGNYLIVTDTAESLRRIESLIAEVDRPGLSRVTEVVPLKFASAEDLANQLTRALTGDERTRRMRAMVPGSDGKPTEAREAVIVASPHCNSLILVGDAAQVAELKRIVALIDVDSPTGRGRFRAVFLKYIAADDAAKSLNALLGKKILREGGKEQVQPGSIIVEPHLANNALLVDAMPRDFELVVDLIRELDVMPQQVLIEVLIAEVSLSDDLDVGIDIAAINMPTEVGNTVVVGSSTLRDDASSLMQAVQTGLFPRGLSVGLARGMGTNAAGSVVTGYPMVANIDALRRDGKFNVLSNVPLLAQNNREASVSIVNNIPMLKSTISGGSGTARDVIQNIDRVDVGIKLKLTPHINPSGEVTMVLNPSIEALIDSGGDRLAPTIARREISTTVSVPDGRTIVLSGLMRQDRTEQESRVPLLGSIPLLGWLFRHKVSAMEKTNLLVFVTPRLVRDYETLTRLTEFWKDSTSIHPTNRVPARVAAPAVPER